MNSQNRIVDIYVRVSTEDQAREGFSLGEQEERLKKLCEYKGYKIHKIYIEAGISAKHGKVRPKFNEMMDDVKTKKINLICVYKLDRLTRSIQDLENIVSLLEEYECGLEAAVEEINTTTANGKFFIRMLTVLSQLEIERCSERTKIGVIGAIKQGHIPSISRIGYKRVNKKMVIDPVTAPIARRIFDLYIKGIPNSLIVEKINKEYDGIIQLKACNVETMVRNRVYTGDYEMKTGDKDGNPTIFKNIVEPIITHKEWEKIQLILNESKKRRNKKIDYIMNSKLICPNCKNKMTGVHAINRAKNKFVYYSCGFCKKIKYVRESTVEELLLKEINEIIDFYLLADVSMLAVKKEPIIIGDAKQYDDLRKNLLEKKERITNTYIDGIITQEEMNKSIKKINKEINECDIQIKIEAEKDIRIVDGINLNKYATLTEIEKRKTISYHTRTNNTWSQLTSEAKSNIISDFIESIEIEITENKETKVPSEKKIIKITKINFYEDKIENMAYLFQKNIMDVVVKKNKKNILLANKMTKNEIDNFINDIREKEKIKTINIASQSYDINKLNENKVVRIMPQMDEKLHEIQSYVIIEAK